jgi:hypothetical protein
MAKTSASTLEFINEIFPTGVELLHLFFLHSSLSLSLSLSCKVWGRNLVNGHLHLI